MLHLETGQKLDRRGMLKQLVDMQFERTNADLRRGSFRMRGQVFEVMPVNEEKIYRLEIGEKIEAIEVLHHVSRKVLHSVQDMWIFPAKHYVAGESLRAQAIKDIRAELKERLEFFKKKE